MTEDPIAWLESHHNYERSGAGPRDEIVHNPQHRIDNVSAFCELMANPQHTFRSVHITGTNGKTSTARMTAKLLEAQGLSVGLFTSPHLERMNERIVINGESVCDEDLRETLHALRLIEMLDAAPKLSYFELLTVAAFRLFADAAVEIAVIEVGVGGRFDATNVIDAEVAVVTNIGLDHKNYLGDNRRDIAYHKFGIVHEGATVIMNTSDLEFRDIVDERSPEHIYVFGDHICVMRNDVAVGGRIVSIRTPRATYEDVVLPLHGAHQAQNAAMALSAVESITHVTLAHDFVESAFATLRNIGRAEVMQRQPLVLIDGAHNTEAAHVLRETLATDFAANSGRVFVVGFLTPHDPIEFLRAVGVHDAHLVVACEPESPRAIPAQDVAHAARACGAPAVVVASVQDAVQEAIAAATDDDIVVITGSLYVVGSAREAFSVAEDRSN